MCVSSCVGVMMCVRWFIVPWVWVLLLLTGQLQVPPLGPGRSKTRLAHLAFIAAASVPRSGGKVGPGVVLLVVLYCILVFVVVCITLHFTVLILLHLFPPLVSHRVQLLPAGVTASSITGSQW